MKLVCTITGAEVTASAEAAVRLIESGSFRPADEPKAAPKPQKAARTRKTAAKGA